MHKKTNNNEVKIDVRNWCNKKHLRFIKLRYISLFEGGAELWNV